MKKVPPSLRDHLALHETVSAKTAYSYHLQNRVCKGSNFTFPTSGGVLSLFGSIRGIVSQKPFSFRVPDDILQHFQAYCLFMTIDTVF